MVENNKKTCNFFCETLHDLHYHFNINVHHPDSLSKFLDHEISDLITSHKNDLVRGKGGPGSRQEVARWVTNRNIYTNENESKKMFNRIIELVLLQARSLETFPFASPVRTMKERHHIIVNIHSRFSSDSFISKANSEKSKTFDCFHTLFPPFQLTCT